MTRSELRPTLAAVCVLLLGSTPVSAQSDRESADAMFRRHSPSVAKVEVFESGATAAASVGTAFFVGSGGLLATNYHVVRDVVYEPEGFEASVILSSGERVPARVVEVSAPDDLALITVQASGEPLTVRGEPPARGARLYSFGYPADLAQSIVEGNFNGRVEHRVSSRYHFTGSLNPGMSGGPALAADGTLVGVNVSTAGNQLSFLVPGEAVASMLARHERADGEEAPLLERVRGQFAHAHDEAVEGLITKGVPTRELAGFVVPWADETVFDCAAATVTDADDLYVARRHACSVEDRVLVTRESSLELIGVTHFTIESEQLNSLRFHTVESMFFQNLQGWLFPESDDTTEYACEPSNVSVSAVKLRVVFCARANKVLSGLHDVFVRTATLGGRDAAVVSTLTMAGVPLPTARRFVSSYLQAFGARP